MSETKELFIVESENRQLSVKDVKKQVVALQELLNDVMQDGVHYGVIPGTDKPTLYKAGAEKIGLLLRLAPSFSRQTAWAGPHLTVVSECVLTDMNGRRISSAGGLCTTRETRYAYRQSTRKCPRCGSAAIIKGKKEYGGGWVCYDKKGGCKAKFADNDPSIINQSVEREENPNLADTYNTVLKIADKRAYVAATLFGTAASDIYTQDVEDFISEEPIPATTEINIEAVRKLIDKADSISDLERIKTSTMFNAIWDRASAKNKKQIVEIGASKRRNLMEADKAAETKPQNEPVVDDQETGGYMAGLETENEPEAIPEARNDVPQGDPVFAPPMGSFPVEIQEMIRSFIPINQLYDRLCRGFELLANSPNALSRALVRWESDYRKQLETTTQESAFTFILDEFWAAAAKAGKPQKGRK